MGNNISHLIIGGNEDEDKDKNNNPIGALEILDHFSENEEEKERGIVIIVGGRDVALRTAKKLLSTLGTHKVIFAQASDIPNILHDISTGNMLDVSHIVVEKKPEPSLEALIQHIGDDLDKRIAVMKDDINSYSILQKSDVLYKKEQEKRRRKHLNKKKISTRKKG